ncbi:hypothetical protein ACKGJN_08390 [Gillisia sp. Q332]|uniref:hypothetical protein n=1 Tax=Gillisia xinjiangensis TaxID=3384765 RepID=UPI00391A80BB
MRPETHVNFILIRLKLIIVQFITAFIRKYGNGTATFKTVNGVELKAMLDGGAVKLNNYDENQSNGVIHLIDTMPFPAK